MKLATKPHLLIFILVPGHVPCRYKILFLSDLALFEHYEIVSLAIRQQATSNFVSEDKKNQQSKFIK